MWHRARPSLPRHATGEDGGKHARNHQPDEVGVQHPLQWYRPLTYGRSSEHITVNESADLPEPQYTRLVHWITLQLTRP
jgi:hypothetical protein